MHKINQLERGVKSVGISNVEIPKPEIVSLSSGLPLHTLKANAINAIKFEIIFEAGRIHEDKRMVAHLCGALLTEGTRDLSSDKISEMVDYEGAYLISGASADFISIRLVSSKNSFSRVLDILSSIISTPLFSDNELKLYVERRKQKLHIDLSKNDVLAYRNLTANLYGPNSSYGYNSSEELLDDLKPEDLQNHYWNYCSKRSAHLFLSGDFNDEHIEKIDGLSHKIHKSDTGIKEYKSQPTISMTVEIPGREKQTSLKLGLRLFNRKAPQYPGIYFLNTVLGGYFGSRLMKNVREQKGYTYNIYSSLDTYKYDGNWIISSELDHANVDKTLNEIQREFSRLKEELMNPEELHMVKNYLMGNFMSTINGPFKAINPYRTTKLMDLGTNFYWELFNTIQALKSEEILNLSKEYLHLDNFWKVIVGKD